MDERNRILATQRAVAQHYGVTTEAVRKWRTKQPPMPGERGNYDLDAIDQWKAENLRPSPTDDDEPTTMQEDRQLLLRAQARKETAKANREERADRLEEEAIVHIDDVQRFVSGFLSEVRRQHQRLPRDFKQGYPPKLRRTIEEDLEERLALLLNSLHLKALELEALTPKSKSK
jgi:hypothetical protein